MSLALITGSNGLVGSEMAIFLLEKGFDVIGIDNNERKILFGIGGDTSPIKKKLIKKYKKYKHFNCDIVNYDDLKNGFFPEDKIKNEGKQMRNVWDIPTAGNESVGHPTQKPVSLYKRCIMTAINKEVEKPLIIDFFAGSGTCGASAKELGYDFILVENNDEYFEIIKKRLNL
jgi:DNA modification methylase